MPDLKIKICGMRNLKNIEEISILKPDYMGFIFYEGSPRYVGTFDFLENEHAILSCILKTGVFVNSHLEYVQEKVEALNLDAVQLHGDEDSHYLGEMKKKLPSKTKIIKAFGVNEHFDFDQLTDFEAADFFLFDTAANVRGGSGKTFDHAILDKYSLNKPFWLSGGIGDSELELVLKNALKWPMLYGIDLNSRIEISPGLKDVLKAKNVLNRITEYNQNTKQ